MTLSLVPEAEPGPIKLWYKQLPEPEACRFGKDKGRIVARSLVAANMRVRELWSEITYPRKQTTAYIVAVRLSKAEARP